MRGSISARCAHIYKNPDQKSTPGPVRVRPPLWAKYGPNVAPRAKCSHIPYTGPKSSVLIRGTPYGISTHLKILSHDLTTFPSIIPWASLRDPSICPENLSFII